MKEMKNAIVTGGTSGIGRAVAEMLLTKGYHVMITYAYDSNATKALEEMSKISPEVEIHEIDQTRRESTYSFLEYVKANFKHIDCMICNAGITRRSTFVESKDSDWDDMMEVAVNSHYIVIRELFNMIPAGSRIVFTGSLMGIQPHGTVLAYGVTKAAVHALMKNLVKEFEGTGTTVNAVAPGFVDTPWQKNKPEEIRNNICRKTAIHRFASVEEIASAFRFCIENDFVNGSIIEVTGGYSYK